MANLYTDPILKVYQDLIQSATGNLFKMVYHGDPIAIPKSSMPALVLSKTRTRIGKISNAEDQHDIEIVITVVADVRDTINDDTQIVPGIAQLYDIIEGRETDSYTLKENSVLNILRSNIQPNSQINLRTDLGSITTTDYGLTVGKRAPDAFGVEAQIQFIANFIQIR